MAHIVTDRVAETTTTTGTGNITLGGAISGYQDFDSQMANADTTVYAIRHRTANEWEVGLGTWNTGNTLSRTTVVRSSNSNAAVNLSPGTKDIFMTFTPTVRQPGMSFTGALTPATNDLAALGSASLSWADLFLAEGGVINWDNGDATITQTGNDVTVAGINTFTVPTASAIQFGAGAAFSITETSGTGILNGGLVLDQGTTSIPPLNFAIGGSLKTTPAAGDVELDATNFYGTTDAGNRGIIPLRHFIRADSTRTYTSNANSQAIFNSPTNGRITLETGAYRFEGLLSFGSMDAAAASNRSINMLGAGTATVSAWVWQAIGQDGATGTAAASSSSHMITSTSPASVITGVASGTLMVRLSGTFEVTGAGTMIPSTTMAVAAASTLSIGSYLEIWRIGTTSVVSVGQWD